MTVFDCNLDKDDLDLRQTLCDCNFKKDGLVGDMQIHYSYVSKYIIDTSAIYFEFDNNYYNEK